MKSSHLRRMRTALLLALVALALAVVPALAGSASAAAPSAHAAKASCRARGRAGARRCRRATRRRGSGGGVPRTGQPLFNADRSLSVSVGLQYGRGGKTTQIVGLRAGNVPVSCPTSGAQSVLVIVQAPLRGSAFGGSQTDDSGVRRLDGRFLSPAKATGTFSVTFPDIKGGGDCTSGTVPFTATR